MNLFELLNDEDKRIVNSISARLSLRKPQRDSLEILARILELNHPKKNDDLIFDSHIIYVETFQKKFVQNHQIVINFLKKIGRENNVVWIKNKTPRFKPIFELTKSRGIESPLSLVSNRQKKSLIRKK